MTFLSFLLGRNKKSANLAKERLQIVIAAERSARGGPRWPEYLPALQRELQGVVSKYVKLQPRDIRVRFERARNVTVIEVIEVKIELPQAARA